MRDGIRSTYRWFLEHAGRATRLDAARFNAVRTTAGCSITAADVTSQNGEDGIIAKILEVLGEPRGWCVEFGAWDGRHLSNTYDLIASKGFSAVMIEGSARRCRDLQTTFKDNPRVVALTRVRRLFGRGRPGRHPRAHADSRDFDVLSIDIDGNDYHVWNAVTRYRPRVVVIEYNPTIPTAVDFVQPADMSINQGSSIAAQARLGKEKGYELVAATIAQLPVRARGSRSPIRHRGQLGRAHSGRTNRW